MPNAADMPSRRPNEADYIAAIQRVLAPLVAAGPKARLSDIDVAADRFVAIANAYRAYCC